MFVELIREKVSEAREALLHEFDEERSHHQKMMSDYTRLQQRFENLQGDVQLLTSPTSHLDPDNMPFGLQEAIPVNEMADSVISEMSDAGGDTMSLDGTQTVSRVAFLIISYCSSSSTNRSFMTVFLCLFCRLLVKTRCCL